MKFKFNQDTDTPSIQVLDGNKIVKEYKIKKGKNYTLKDMMALLNLKSCNQDVKDLCFDIFKYNIKNFDHFININNSR